MSQWLPTIAVLVMLAHSAWGMWLVRSQHRDLSQLSAQMAAFMMRQLAGPRPESLRPAPAAPARERFDPPRTPERTPIADQITTELERVDEDMPRARRSRTAGVS